MSLEDLRETLYYHRSFKIMLLKERYEARSIAKSFSQRKGIDCEETFSLVVKIATVRCLVSLVVNKGWTFYQLDVNNAFMYGDLDEDVYMSLPEGLFNKNDKWVLYVDDIVLTGNNIEEINRFKEFLKSKFLIKDLGKLKYFLGIEVVDIDAGLYLNQRKYCLELLAEYSFLASKPAATLIETNLMVSDIIKIKKKKKPVEKNNPPLTDLTSYQRLIWKLIYLTLTRPDISYIVHSLSQFMHKPEQSHVKLAIRVLIYSKRDPSKGVGFNKGYDLSLKSYVDFDLAKCPTRKSVIGYLLFFANPVFHERTKNLKIDMHLLQIENCSWLIDGGLKLSRWKVWKAAMMAMYSPLPDLYVHNFISTIFIF
nr:ribonuclease H-like domain-containing protein [Tanacetum cinerariifolium]